MYINTHASRLSGEFKLHLTIYCSPASIDREDYNVPFSFKGRLLNPVERG